MYEINRLWNVISEWCSNTFIDWAPRSMQIFPRIHYFLILNLLFTFILKFIMWDWKIHLLSILCIDCLTIWFFINHQSFLKYFICYQINSIHQILEFLTIFLRTYIPEHLYKTLNLFTVSTDKIFRKWDNSKYKL